MLAGTTYQPSGVVKISSALFIAPIALLISVFIGLFYGFISNVNPFVYLNILLLLIMVLCLSFVIRLAGTLAKSRSSAFNFMLGLACCLVAYYAHWAYLLADALQLTFIELFTNPVITLSMAFEWTQGHEIVLSKSRRSSGITISGIMLQLVYVIELILFIAPALISIKVDYFCEHCQVFLTENKLFTSFNEPLKQQILAAQGGHYAMLKDNHLTADHASLLSPDENSQSLLKINFHYCPKCHQNSLLDIDEVTYEQEKNKKELKEKDSNSLIQGIYLDSQSSQLLTEASAQ